MGKCQQKHFNFIFYTASSRGFIEPGANIPGMLSAPRILATRASARVFLSRIPGYEVAVKCRWK